MTEPSEPQQPQKRKKPPPNPYIVTGLLFLFAAWFLYDGFFNPEIESIWFNRIGGVLFLIAGIWDGLRQRRLQLKREALEQT